MLALIGKKGASLIQEMKKPVERMGIPLISTGRESSEKLNLTPEDN